MFGYATNETESFMPIPLWLSHRLAQQLATARKSGLVDYLRPDGKTQVTIGYENGIPVEVNTIVISTQHHPGISNEQISRDVREHVIAPMLELVDLDSSSTRYLINPSGDFVTGGPDGDAGLTGRKIIVDTYGGAARHGGGAFSGKDPTKVDRSAAYALRWVAKNAVAAGLADKIELQVSYAIGTAHPVSLFVETFGTEKVSVEAIEKAVLDTFDLRPRAIIEELELLTTSYLPTAAYGHFGRMDVDFPWERLTKWRICAKLVDCEPNRRIAQVILETRLPQLDRLFDYEIPPHLEVSVGSRVKVPLRQRKTPATGFVVAVVEESDHRGALALVIDVVGQVPLMGAELWELAEGIAARQAGSAADVLRLAIPPRYVRAEKKWLESLKLPLSDSEPVAAPVFEEEYPAEAWDGMLESGSRTALYLPHGVRELSSGESVPRGGCDGVTYCSVGSVPRGKIPSSWLCPPGATLPFMKPLCGNGLPSTRWLSYTRICRLQSAIWSIFGAWKTGPWSRWGPGTRCMHPRFNWAPL